MVKNSMQNLDQLTANEIRRRLAVAQSLTPDSSSDLPLRWNDAQCRPAGVLVPLIREADRWKVIFIRRAQHEKDHHSGQVAFAGGKHEAHDQSLQHTALREAHEEIGLHPEHVTVLGELAAHYSITRFRITPVVARITWPQPLTPEVGEVARIFSIPLDWLADAANFRLESRQLEGRTVPVVFYREFDGELLWGATARMTLSLIKALTDQQSFR